MHIIFGDSVTELPDTFTILELDTFKVSTSDEVVTAYCVVEKIPLTEFPLLEAHKKVHEDLIKAYRGQHWNYCEQAIGSLTGKWNGELDTFYSSLLERIQDLKETTLPEDWDGVLVKD